MKISNLSLKHKDINLLQDCRASTDLKIALLRKIQLRKIFWTHAKKSRLLVSQSTSEKNNNLSYT